jgi:hypothetical protein
MSARPEIELYIDELVLHGVSPSPGLTATLKQELVRLLSEEGGLDALLAAAPGERQIARISSSPVRGGKDLGQKLGQAIYRSLCGALAPPQALAPPAAPTSLASPAKSHREDKP